MIAGDGPAPLLVLLAVRALPDTSMTAALASGGPHHLGWGLDRWIAKHTYDALNQNTRATGSWKKGNVPDFPPFPGPDEAEAEVQKAEGKKRTTVRDIFSVFNRR